MTDRNYNPGKWWAKIEFVRGNRQINRITFVKIEKTPTPDEIKARFNTGWCVVGFDEADYLIKDNKLLFDGHESRGKAEQVFKYYQPRGQRSIE